ncbi:hypothetical protein ACSW9V_10370 [Clostridium perfringens]|uniref:hypothetical protein n=1 Tax=Clostridium perfringens TaxID=1502 RepID=UPI0024BCC35A|nr:hypothetical protein [Clostridium perfringens]
MEFSREELILIKKAIIIAKSKVKQENNIEPDKKRFKEINGYDHLIERLNDINL